MAQRRTEIRSLLLRQIHSHFISGDDNLSDFKAEMLAQPTSKETDMSRDQATNDRLSKLLQQLSSLTQTGELHWERQLGSAHRYARWKNNLLILGPAESPSETKVPRYLFVTPFDSPSCVEICSNDAVLGNALLELVKLVEQTSKDEPPTDPFGISEEELRRITN